jgi:hypothetical protein
MSNVKKIMALAAGQLILGFVVAGIVLTLLSMALMLLVPAATAGAVHITWLQGLSIITLAIISRLVLFPSAKIS